MSEEELFKLGMYSGFVDQNCSVAIYVALVIRYKIRTPEEVQRLHKEIDDVENHAIIQKRFRVWQGRQEEIFIPN